MPKLRAEVVETSANRIEGSTRYAVLYILATHNFDAIDCDNNWAKRNGFERARELTLGQARKNNQEFYIARCYRTVEGER